MIGKSTETVFHANCDVCNKQFEHWHEGWTVWFEESNMIEQMWDQKWYVDDEKKCYCTECHTVDDEDVLHIKQKEVNNE